MRASWLLVLCALLVAGVALRAGVQAAPPHRDDPRVATGQDQVVLLAAQWCGYCRRLQGDFARAHVRYRTLDIDTPEGARALRAVGGRGVPVTIIGQQVIHGYDPAGLDKALIPLGYRVY